MNTKRSNRTNKNEYALMRKVLAAILAALVLAVFTSGFGKGLVNAQDAEVASSQESDTQKYTAEKYYKSIEIQPGDSLWSIAEENRDKHYTSTKEYVKEIKQINGLYSDQIHSGQYLMIAYYK